VFFVAALLFFVCVFETMSTRGGGAQGAASAAGGEGDDMGDMDFDQEELMQMLEASENPLEKAVDKDFFNRMLIHLFVHLICLCLFLSFF
jgi:hypothetical protein